MKHYFALPLISAALIGLPVQYSSAQPNGALDQFNALTEQLMMFPVIPESVFRNGDTLHFQLGGEGGSAQISSSCKNSKASIDYIDFNTQSRVYIGSDGKSYAPSYPLGEEAIKKLNENVSYKGLCNTVSAPNFKMVFDNDGKWSLIDINSIESIGGKKSLWVLYDYPLIAFDEPYSAPYSEKREHVVIDCDNAQAQLLAGYDVTFDGAVTDGKVGSMVNPIGAYPLSDMESDQAILNAVCKLAPNELKQLPDYSPRVKTPVPLEAPALEEQPLQAIRGMSIPSAKKSFSYLKTVGIESYHGEESPIRVDYFVQGNAGGYYKMVLLMGGSKTYVNSFAGLIDLSSKSVIDDGRGGNVSTSQVNYLEFSGDWVNLPVGSEISYRIKETRYNSTVGQVGNPDKLKVYNCRVEKEAPASIINASLSGGSKQLSCSLEGDRYNRVDTYYFLEDYGYFFHGSTSPNDFYASRNMIEEIK